MALSSWPRDRGHPTNAELEKPALIAATSFAIERATRLFGSVRLEAVERVLGLFPPFVASRVLTAALRATGVQIGRSSIFWGLPTLTGEGDICPRLKIGAGCGFNFGCHFELDDEIAFGEHVSVGHEVMFLTRTHTTSNPVRRAGAPGHAPISVGSGAWLGSRSIVLAGVTIGAGAVIGASVVVSKDVPPDILVTGSRRISLAKWG